MKLTIDISPKELHGLVRRYLQDEHPGAELDSVYVRDSFDNNLISIHKDHMIIYPQTSATRYPVSS